MLEVVINIHRHGYGRMDYCDINIHRDMVVICIILCIAMGLNLKYCRDKAAGHISYYKVIDGTGIS